MNGTKVFSWKPLPTGWYSPLPLIPAASGAGSGHARNTGVVIPQLPHIGILVWVELSALYLGPESDHRGLNVVDYQRICMSLSCTYYSLGFLSKGHSLLKSEEMGLHWLVIFQKALCYVKLQTFTAGCNEAFSNLVSRLWPSIHFFVGQHVFIAMMQL